MRRSTEGENVARTKPRTKAVDVAAYIMERRGSMTAMKLQKLLYYSQAWSLVWDERPLFSAQIEAWANGPVVPSIYALHRGAFKLPRDFFDEEGDPSVLTQDQRDTVDAVLRHYGNKSSAWLSELTHREAPWKQARRGLRPGDRGAQTITHGAMAEYYGGLIR